MFEAQKTKNDIAKYKREPETDSEASKSTSGSVTVRVTVVHRERSFNSLWRLGLALFSTSLAMANKPRLPLEVMERIINDVADDKGNCLISYYSSIKACALVCHSFLPLCRKYIFAFVTLNVLFQPLCHLSFTSDRFNRFLLDSPHLAVYFWTLDYHVNEKELVAKNLPWLPPIVRATAGGSRKH